jgi:hypothetical protein
VFISLEFSSFRIADEQQKRRKDCTEDLDRKGRDEDGKVKRLEFLQA